VSTAETVPPAVQPVGPGPAPARAATGITGLDAIVEGGFPEGRSVLVCGAPGTGKTTLALHFLMEGVRAGQTGVLVVTDQKPRHVIDDARRVGLDLGDAIERGLLTILDAEPYFSAARDEARRLEARQVTAELARRVRETRATRLAIDSVSALVPETSGSDEARDYLRTLVFSAEDNLGCTAVLTSAHVGVAPLVAAARHAEALVSGVVELKLVPAEDGRYERRLLVRKMRGTAAPPGERRFEILPGRGIVVGE
jgi:circadian clock protein KaiC